MCARPSTGADSGDPEGNYGGQGGGRFARPPAHQSGLNATVRRYVVLVPRATLS